MKLLLPLALILSSALAHAKPAPYHGNFIICANEENTVKMTADLSDGKSEKVATAVQNGVKMVFPESQGGHSHYFFSFYPAKKTPLLVLKRGEREPEIRLSADPAGGEPEVLHDRKDPLIYKMIRFKALLSLKTFKVHERPVSCTESKWESD